MWKHGEAGWLTQELRKKRWRRRPSRICRERRPSSPTSSVTSISPSRTSLGLPRGAAGQNRDKHGESGICHHRQHHHPHLFLSAATSFRKQRRRKKTKAKNFPPKHVFPNVFRCVSNSLLLRSFFSAAAAVLLNGMGRPFKEGLESWFRSGRPFAISKHLGTGGSHVQETPASEIDRDHRKDSLLLLSSTPVRQSRQSRFLDSDFARIRQQQASRERHRLKTQKGLFRAYVFFEFRPLA